MLLLVLRLLFCAHRMSPPTTRYVTFSGGRLFGSPPNCHRSKQAIAGTDDGIAAAIVENGNQVPQMPISQDPVRTLAGRSHIRISLLYLANMHQ